MAAAAEPLLMTVEEYRQLPSRENVVLELHWGAVVEVTRPKLKHTKLQYRLTDLLRQRLATAGTTGPELPFQALPEYELRTADVAFVSQARWEQALDDENLHGSPELVIEILSPSNTVREMREKCALCLSTGALEFWIVDSQRKSVTVSRKEGAPLAYGLDDSLSLAAFGGDSLAVASIFE